jgi:hypothetical protein
MIGIPLRDAAQLVDDLSRFVHNAVRTWIEDRLMPAELIPL